MFSINNKGKAMNMTHAYEHETLPLPNVGFHGNWKTESFIGQLTGWETPTKPTIGKCHKQKS